MMCDIVIFMEQKQSKSDPQGSGAVLVLLLGKLITI